MEERANFMVDTGSDINVIKKESHNENVPINSKIVLELSGITKGRTRTIGVAKIRIFDILFHVVPNNFPIRGRNIGY